MARARRFTQQEVDDLMVEGMQWLLCAIARTIAERVAQAGRDPQLAVRGFWITVGRTLGMLNSQ